MRPSRSSRSPSGAQNSARLEFALLWDTYARSIYSYCFRRTADAALAEDLTSIVFLEAWRRRKEVAVPPDKALPWLYGVATNVLRNQRRSRRRYDAALRRYAPPRPEPDFADALVDRLDQERHMRQILDQLGQLSPLEQEALALCVWQGLSQAEAAHALAIPETTVRTRLHRAREHLRALVPAAETPDPSFFSSSSDQGVDLL
jgi:RNA polymerase sigma-70 factor (ECF subfamily)